MPYNNAGCRILREMMADCLKHPTTYEGRPLIKFIRQCVTTMRDYLGFDPDNLVTELHLRSAANITDALLDIEEDTANSARNLVQCAKDENRLGNFLYLLSNLDEAAFTQVGLSFGNVLTMFDAYLFSLSGENYQLLASVAYASTDTN